MSKKNQTVPETDLTTEVMEGIARKNVEDKGKNLFLKEITMISDSSVYKQNMPLKHPFRTIHPQVVLVTQGYAEFSINLVSQKLQKGHLLLLADYETLPRTVTYYADKLEITANYLSTAVRKVSGKPQAE